MMRYLFLSLMFSLVGLAGLQAQKKVPMAELDLQPDGKYYQRNHIETFSGVATEEFPNGKKKAHAEFKDGKLHGKVTTWHKTGEKAGLVHYDKGILTGTETHWYDTGIKKLEVSYDVIGLASGICKEYYPDGQVKSEGTYAKDLEEGLHKWYFQNGKLDQTIPYKGGLANGKVKHHYKEGTLKMEGDYKDGKPQGLVTFYYTNGQRKQTTQYQTGLEEGMDSIWSAQGLLLEVREYRAGAEHSFQNFRSGAIQTQGGYLQVFNEARSFFSVHIQHPGWVRPRASRDITYVVDDFVLQLFNIPISSFTSEKNLSDTEILQLYLQYEKPSIEENTGMALDIQQETQPYHNGHYLHWSFESPEAENPPKASKYTVVREHYFTFVCGEQVLVLYVPQVRDNDPQKIQSAIQDIAKSIRVENKRIDLQARRMEIRQNNGLPPLPANETFKDYKK